MLDHEILTNDQGERVNLLAPEIERWDREDEPVIALESVSKRFGDNVVLDGLSLEVYQGESVVVMGRSGSGKTVLIKLMNGLLIPDEGHVRLFGVDTREASRKELMQLRRRVATLFQSYALFDSMTVEQNIAFPLAENTSMDGDTIHQLVDDLLRLLDLPGTNDLVPSELSGGMKKRVSLARSVIANPEVVLFDEPTTGLDPIMIEFVDELIMKTQREFGLTSLIISHDLDSIRRLADRVALLDRGKIVFEGVWSELTESEHPTAVDFVGAGGERGLREQIEEQQEGEIPPVEVLEERAEEADGAVAPSDIDDDALIVVRDVYKSFGERTVLKGVSFHCREGEITTLIGGSGSGKTVTMKILLGLIPADSGSIRALGREVTALDRKELVDLRLRFGMLFQGAALFDSMTIRENVAFPLDERPGQTMGRKEIAERVDEVLERLKISDLGPKSPAEISSGQRKRVGLARAIAADPKVIVYDEPTTGLDPVMIRYVNDMIEEAQETFGITTVVISHDMASTFRISHRVAMLYHGEIVAFGTPDEVRASDDPRVQRFIFAGTDTPAKEAG